MQPRDAEVLRAVYTPRSWPKNVDKAFESVSAIVVRLAFASDPWPERSARAGLEHAAAVRRIALEIYAFAAAHARARDILIADTKFEFGVDKAGNVLLIDEVLTPDSSRFWPVASYKRGISPPSFDKQFVRDYLESLHWNKKPPAPHLPPDVLARTSDNYREALRLLTE